MKQLITLFLCSLMAINLFAQTDTTKIGTANKNVVTVIENNDETRVIVGKNNGLEVVTDDHGDTTFIRLGRRNFRVIESGNETRFQVDREPAESRPRGSFNPHWAGVEVGINMFSETNYALYGNDEFFDLIPGKSLTWNVNFAEWAFKNDRNTFGLVTGLGISFSDYTFDRPITIVKENGDGMIIPEPLNPDGLKKSKLKITYLTAPLMLEIKTPLKAGGQNLYIAGGVIGSVNIGSHTKYKYRKEKEKYRGNFHLNTFKYELTGRIGFGDFCIFTNYSLSPLFKDRKGPELYPFLIGISFINF